MNSPTHSKGHIPDLICCSGLTPSNCLADHLPITDYLLLSFNVKIALSITKLPRLISFRNIKDISPEALSSDVNSLQNINNPSTPDELVSHYNIGLHSILNSLAHLKTQPVSFSISAPWFTLELWLMKAKGHQLKWLYRKAGLVIHKTMHKKHITS